MADSTATVRPEDCLAGGGAMGERMRSLDWDATPYGPPARWPQSLRTAISIMLESHFAMVVAWGPDFRFFYNDRYRPVLGNKHPEALGTPAAEIFPEVWPTIGPAFERVLRGVAIASDDWLLPLERNGYLENCWFTLSYSPIRDETGGVGGLLAVVAETTGRVEGERRLATLRDLARSAADAKTPEEACQSAIRVFEQNPIDVPFAIFYLSDGRTARRVCVTGLPADHPANVESIDLSTDRGSWPLQRAAETGRLELLTSLPDRFGTLPGGPYPEPTHSVVVVPLARPRLDHPYGFLVAGVSPRRAIDERYQSFYDLAAEHIVTAIENARAYEEERRRAESLAELDRAKTAFFSNVSHEFRTPLTLMLGPVADAIRSPTAALAGEPLEVVHRNAIRLLKLVNTLLDFSRIEAGRVEASYQPTDLAAFTAELASGFRSAIERAGLELRVECAPLPEPVWVDREMWEKIVLNLLSNALKFTFEGHILVALDWRGDRVALTVADTGTGVAEEQLPHLFERFHRVAGARSRTHEGTGIGLALVRELARMHGGDIAVRSTAGSGSSFTVEVLTGRAHFPAERILPEAVARSSTDRAAFSEESSRWLDVAKTPAGALAAAPDSSGERVLIADDNADMRDYLRRLLSERWTVEAVPDGLAALAAARARPPDLVLADVMMPGLDGFGLLRALRDDPATKLVPVVMLSARAGEEARVEGLDAGADDYLVKPFSARELLARVGSQLALARMRRAEEKYRSQLYDLFQQAPAPISVMRGPELVFEMANALYHRVAGRSAIVGKPFQEVFPELREQGFAELLEKVMATGEPYVGRETRLRLERPGTATLEDSYWTFIYSPLASADGVIDRVVVFCSDVTEQVVARREVEATSRAKDEFMATLSHELRSPLNAIIGWTHILRDGVDATTTRRALDAISRNALMQSQLIADILDVQRLSSGKLRLNLTEVALGDVIEAALDTVRPAAQAKEITLLPILDSEVGRVPGDPDRLQQIVWNLVSNAIKFTPKGGRVQIRMMRVNSDVEMTVEDNGPGIDPAFLPFLFDRFRQGNSSSTRQHGGIGLGLSIVRSLAELHGGSVSAANRESGTGAVFTVKLPRMSVAPPKPVNVAFGRRGPTQDKDVWIESAPRLHKIKVLVIDDDPDAREVVAVVLSQCGADVVVATGAVEGLGLLARERPDVIVCDIEMPELDGYEFIRRARALPREQGGRTPAAALTAYASTEDRMRALNAGFQIHVPKPVQPAELATVVASLAESHPHA